MILILGAGLSGLSAAYHLNGQEKLLIERDEEVGGLCRSFRERGFTFDCTGHLLHLRDADIRTWVKKLLPDGWRQLQRHAFIYSQDLLTPYPYQANTAGLPVDVQLECLLGFIETRQRPRHRADTFPEPVSLDPPFLKLLPEAREDEPSFLDWIHETFGSGFAKHFFVPYNTKLFQRDLAEITGDWVSWSIPQPELADVLRGALSTTNKAFGYNPDFLYPRAGGIDALPAAIASQLAPGVLRTGCSVDHLEAGTRRITLDGGERHEGKLILSSLPLTRLASITGDLPAELRAGADRLRHVSVRAVNLGVRGEPAHPNAQWIYFPAPEVPFYRVGLPTALTSAMAPPGHHQLVAEIAFRPDSGPSTCQSLEETIDALLKCGTLRNPNDIVHAEVRDIPEAYVVFDHTRRRVLPRLLHWYLERNIVPIGRYGAWDYLSMEDCLIHGREVARWAERRGPQPHRPSQA